MVSDTIRFFEGSRLTADLHWESCGRLPGADSISGFAVQGGALYATALYQRGVHRYDGKNRWVSCGDPGRRLLALGVFDGHLFGAGNDHVNIVYRRPDGNIGWIDPSTAISA